MIAVYRIALAAIVSGTVFLPPPPQATPPLHLGECPHYWAGASRGPLGDSIPIADDQANVPEYNDCQRFIERGLSYSDIQAIWVRAHIRRFYDRVDQLPPLGPGAYKDSVGGQPAMFLPGDSSGATTRRGFFGVVGIIWSDGPYRQLGLRQGWSCVVMQWQAPGGHVAGDSYKAFVVNVKDKFVCKNLGKMQLRSAYPLQVTAIRPTRRDLTPEVARWDWDAEARDQFMGMWCPSGWCEFHNPGYHTSPSHNSSVGSYAASGGMFVREKGYYDDQLLADPMSGGKALEGGHVRGTIFPEPNIGSRTMLQYTNHWLRVARVSLSAPSPVYYRKYLYLPHPGDPDGNDTFVSLCFKPGAPLSPSSAPNGPCAGKPPSDKCVPDTGHSGYWYMMIRNPKSEERMYCVIYRQAPKGVIIPNVVRWRWAKSDEVIWMGCPSGCCEGDGKNSII